MKLYLLSITGLGLVALLSSCAPSTPTFTNPSSTSTTVPKVDDHTPISIPSPAVPIRTSSGSG